MERHPIIANGELYAEPISKALGSGEKVMPREYFEAKERILGALDRLTEDIAAADQTFLDEKVICIRMEPKFRAKSYVPATIVGAMTEGRSQIIGGRNYTITERADKPSAKLYFVRTTDAGIMQLKTILREGQKDGVDAWKQQLRSIHTIDLLNPDEKVMGFDGLWENGTVEFILHPLPADTATEIASFFHHSGIEPDKAKVKTYDDGITFISAVCAKDNLQRAKGYNPLRAVHPLGEVNITPIRAVGGSSCPAVLHVAQQPSIRIGVFDGGADETIPILAGYVTAIDSTSEPAEPDFVEHGSGVCSAILYGNLAGKTGADTLAPPCVSIDCFRVLPLKDDCDYDLYEAIDLIENIVPNSPNTRLYNLSFGPQGAIVDDSISRFTYALDKLAYDVPEGTENPLFVVAVGNDGELPHGLNRVQAPSDVVNGLGIGAFTYNADREKIPASYSCIGPGREGAKTKPDLLDFGGDIGAPFIIPSTDHVSLSETAGTSFAAPMVTGKIGRLMAMSDRVSPHMGRTLAIHSATCEKAFPKEAQGFGFCAENVSDILECSDNQVTIMYSGSIRPTQFLNLPIFAPRISEMRGNVSIRWTVSVVVAPDCNDPDAYTNNCLEDVFIPHSMTYRFSKRGCKAHTINLLDETKIALARQLMDQGYSQSSTPVTHPAKKIWTEDDLRTVDLKWDTVIHRGVTMRGTSLFNPLLTLHAMGRNGFGQENMRYNVVVTIDAPKYDGSLYDAILQTYRNLAPIEIRNIGRLLT